MNQTPADSDWAAARGEKWRAQLSFMEAMLQPVEAPLIQALELDRPYRIADIGCGGGGTTLAILNRAPAGSVVHGFDIAPTLIAAARARAEARPIAFEVADMGTATPPAGTYERLVSRFGIMFFGDPPAAFANLIGWLTPGGRFAFAAWGQTAKNPWFTCVRDAVAEVVAIPPADPQAPGPFRYAEADKLLHLLDRAGFSDLEVRDWHGALPLGGLPAAAAVNFALAAFSSFGELLAAAGGTALRDARQSLTERFSRHEQDGVVRMDACVHLFTGARP